MQNYSRIKQNRTDMQDEIVGCGNFLATSYGVSISRIKRNGHIYSIINAPNLDIVGSRCAKYVEFLIKNELENVFKIKEYKNIIFFGLGNENITADALGGKVVKKLFVSKDLEFDCQTCAVCPSVQAKTGLETADIIKAITKEFQPDLVVFFDTLASSTIERLGCCFQINNEGIAAGSGVGNINKMMNKKFLGTNCIVCGVPFMIYADKVIKSNKKDILNDFVLTPKNIDRQINNCAEIISNSFNYALFPELSKEEINNIISF